MLNYKTLIIFVVDKILFFFFFFEDQVLLIVLEVLYNAIYLEKSKGWLNKNYWMRDKFYLSRF